MYRSAVIGLGRMGAEPSVRLNKIVPAGWLPISHLESILSVPQLDLVALCDSDKNRLNHIGNLYGVDNLYNNPIELLQNERIFFLTLATRTTGRTKLIKEAALNRVSILYLEKPLGFCLDECQQAIYHAESNGMILGYGVNRRYHNIYIQAKKLVDSKIVGDLQHIILENGKSNLLWTHPHSVDLMMFFSGSTDVEYISGICDSNKNDLIDQNKVLDCDPIVLNAFVLFNNGISASINMGNGFNVKLICSNGFINIVSDGSFIEIVNLNEFGYFKNKEIIYPDSQIESATVNAFSSLLKTQLNEPLPITNEEIYFGMVILLGIAFSSIMNSKLIQVKDIPLDFTVTGKTNGLYP
jgi:predicted dehydrogenase